MTHDELLEKIRKRNGELCDAIMDADDKICRPFHAGFSALRAVVELHTPATKNSFRNNDCICMLPNKKCATIQAIEKELS